MGWLEYQATEWKKGQIDRKAELIKEFTSHNDNASWEVLKCSMVGSVGYMAIKYTNNNDPEKNCVFGCVCLTSVRDKWYFAYKDMSESMGPYYYDCPKSIINLLTPTDNENALAWRQKCIENSKGDTMQKQLQKAKVGSRIRVTYKYDTTLAKKDDVVIFQKHGGKQPWQKKASYEWITTNGRIYRISAKMILANNPEWVEYIV